MKLKLFVEQPDIELHTGIKVFKDTELSYSNEKVEQEIKDLTLETIINDEGSNGINTYTSKTYLKITLNEGDILEFNDTKGFYLPTYPLTAIEDAINDINSLEDRKDEEINKEG